MDFLRPKMEPIIRDGREIGYVQRALGTTGKPTVSICL